MVQIIAGRKGKGKTKHLLDMANSAIKGAKGTVVYLDKSSQHMYELNNKIRLITVQNFPITTSEAFVGFICGIISQDHDLETMYLDSFLTISSVSDEYIGFVLSKLKDISSRFNINFVISISVDAEHLPDDFKDDIIISL